MKKKNQGSGSSLLRVLGAIGFVLAVAFLVLQQANFLLSRGMLIAFGDNEATYKSAWFEWDGDIVAKDVVIYPYGLGEGVTIRFERVHLETPGWFWFVRNTFDRKLKFAKLDRIHLTLEGGSSDTGFDPSLGDLGPFSIDAASPFEAEGCAVDGMWVREELAEMGLQTEPPRLEFDYVVDRDSLKTTVILETKGASRVHYQRSAQLPMAINALLIDQYPHRVLSERWEVQDQGFVAARNAHCAKKDGIDVETFLARHAASVERLLEVFGIGVDAATRQAYLGFARNGGALVFGGDYTPPIAESEFYDLRDLGQAWPRMQNAQLSLGARSVAVRWTPMEPRDLPGLEEGDSTFAALMKERGGEPLPGASVGASQAAAAPAVAVTTVSNETTTTTVASTAPAAVTAAGSAAGVQVATAASASAAPGSLAAASATAAAPNIIRLEPSSLTRTRGYLAWGDMPGYRGQRVRLWTLRNPPRLVEVLEADGGALRISTRVGGGTAEYTVHRDSFLRARALR